MKIAGKTWFGIALMAIAVFVIILGLRMPYYEEKLLPLIFGAALFIVTGVVVAREISASRSGAGKKEKEPLIDEYGKPVTWKSYLFAAVWLLGYLAGVLLIGFMFTSFIFILLYMKTHRVSWLGSIISSIVAPAVLWTVFNFLMETPLFTGKLGII